MAAAAAVASADEPASPPPEAADAVHGLHSEIRKLQDLLLEMEIENARLRRRRYHPGLGELLA